MKTKRSEVSTGKGEIANKVDVAKPKFTNSLRESISNEKSKVLGVAETSSTAPKPVAVSPKVSQVAKKPVVAQVASKKIAATKTATVSTKTPAPQKVTKEPKITAESRTLFDKVNDNFKYANEESKASLNKTIFDWQYGFKNLYTKMLKTMSEELAQYINNIATSGNIQNLTQANLAYFEKIKKLQSDLLKDISGSYISSFTSHQFIRKKPINEICQ